MSVPRQAVKRQKLERKRRRKQQATSRRRAKRQAAPYAGDFFGPGFAVNGPVGGIAMSTVLDEFVDPWMDLANDRDSFTTLISIGVVAWNAALEPEHQRDAMVRQAIDERMEGESLHDRMMCRTLIDQLIDRKLRYFANFRRPVLAFDVQELEEGGFYLSVVSAVV